MGYTFSGEEFGKRERMPPELSSLAINEKKTVEVLISYLKGLRKSYSSSGILLGLSGGIDSAVLATLGALAIGKDNVHASYLYDRDSGKESIHHASLMADWLGLKLDIQDITPAMKKKGVYAHFSMQVGSLSARFNRLFTRLYCLLFQESPFISSLREGSNEFDHNRFKRQLYNLTVRHVMAAVEARHIYRRTILEEKARSLNLTLLGAANRTESMTGWFIKGGIDDLPLQPLIGLYKTQVRQLAKFLGLPMKIQIQSPSPDMIKGITDEFGIGMDYGKLDLALDYLDRGLAEDEIIANGITKKELQHVRELHRLSEWKRGSHSFIPPVDGGPRGNIRLHSFS
jgi:NAD+ synthase